LSNGTFNLRIVTFQLISFKTSSIFRRLMKSSN